VLSKIAERTRNFSKFSTADFQNCETILCLELNFGQFLRFVFCYMWQVDLAGSERQSKTGATGDRLKVEFGHLLFQIAS
jgi:hypothetical protein